MRIDLTVCDPTGTPTDVAVLSRVPAPWAAVIDAAPDRFGSARWVGETPVDTSGVVGTSPLRHGAVLTSARRGRPPRGDTVVRVSGGPDGGAWCALLHAPVVVGRDPGCDLVLTDPDVSRRHLVIRPGEPAATVVDLDSTNGTWLDDVRVRDAMPLPLGSTIRLGETWLTVDRTTEPPALVRSAPDGTVVVNRPVRVAGPPPEVAVIALPDESPEPWAGRVPWVAALAPAALGVVLALVLRSPQYLLFALLSPVLMVSAALSDRWTGRRRARREQSERRDACAGAQATVAVRVASERAAAWREWPDASLLARIAEVPTVRLWERSGRSILAVRVGVGTVPSGTQVRDAGGLRPAGELNDVPIRVDLADGPLGVVAPAGRGLRCVRWLIAQLATLYSPAELEVCVVGGSGGAARWEWARWLPHFHGRVAVDADSGRRVIAELTDERDRRRAASHGGGPAPPWVVAVVDVGSGAGELPGLVSLGLDGGAYRITAIYVSDRRSALPGGTATVLLSDGETGSRGRLEVRGQAGFEVVFDQVSAAWAESVARSLAPYVDAEPAGRAPITDSLRLPELHGQERFDSAAVSARWAQDDSGATAIIGAGPGGPIEFDLVRSGPHALVAGTTGAGKSELLQTWVAGLALAYAPSDVAFVLVDYKGGAAFGACAALPHVTAVVTDLDAALTRRALRSLHTEVTRRERLLAEVGRCEYHDYRTSTSEEPLPRLVIVVDEFATLAEELPDFVPGLIAVARRGRSLGVHLILATQRPGGVVSPEIRANTALRVALRVLDPAESIDVIGTDAASTISVDQPGRAFVVRGGSAEAMQVARVTTGAPTSSVRVRPLDRWRRPLPDPVVRGGTTDLDDLVAATTAAVGELGLSPPRRPWLPPLPAAVGLTGLDAGEPTERDVIAFGLLDLPDEQRQPVATLDLAAGGAVLFVGSARSGRSTALLGIAAAAARSRGADRLQAYGLDFAGGTLSCLHGLPQVGTVVQDDGATAAALLAALEERVGVRQRRLASGPAGLATDRGADARGAQPQDADAPPSLLLLLDGWEGFVRASEEFDHGASVEQLCALLRAGGRVGLTVAVAGDRSACAPRLAALMRERYVLRLNDPADYAAAGLRPADVPSLLPPGRAVRASDGAELLVAHPGVTEDLAATRAAVAELGAQADRVDVGAGRPTGDLERPIVIRALPERVRLRELAAPSGTVALGRAGPDAAALCLNLLDGAGRWLLAGPPRSGRSTVLRSLIAQRDRIALPLVLAAPPHSPARREAEAAGLTGLDPGCSAEQVTAALGRPALLLLDDSETFLDTPAGDALYACLRSRPELAAVVAGRSDELLLTYRGVVAEVRRFRCALLLQPRVTDLELVGERAAHRLAQTISPGRGLIRGDPQSHPAFARGPVPIQVALP